MATKGSETNTQDEVTEQIAANIERVRSLAEAENFEGAVELYGETATLIKGIKGAGSQKRKKELTDQLNDASEAKPAEPVHEGTVVVLETQDYTEVPGVEELITKGAADLAEGVKLHLKAADTARSTAEVLLEMRLKMQDKHGAPDLAAKSNAAKQAAQAMYNAVRGEDKLEDTFENRDAVKKLMRAVQYQMSQVVVDYVRALDSNPEEAAKFAKATEANPDTSPSDAVFSFYGINRESQAELAAKREADKRALAAGARAAIENGDEGEGEGEGEGGGNGEAATEIDPDTYAKAVTDKFAKLSKAVNVHLIEAASDDTKEEVRGDLEAQLGILKSLIAATL